MNGDPYSTFHRIGKLISAKSAIFQNFQKSELMMRSEK